MMTMPLDIASLIRHAARWHGDTEIVSRETGGEICTCTWTTVEQDARRLLSALRGLGVNPGDRVATLAWNNQRHLKTWFATSGGGMVCHTINPRLFPEQLVFIINDAADRVVMFDRTFLALIAGIRDQLPTVAHFVLLGPHDAEVATSLPGVLFFDDLVQDHAPSPVWPDIDENAPSSLCYTSGTTGNPKGVLFTHRSTLLHAISICLPDVLNLSARDTLLPAAPMFHVNAWGVPYAAAMVGAKLVLPGPGLDGDSLVTLIEDHRVTIALGVPTIWVGLLAAAEKRGAKLASLTRNLIGGAAAPPAMIAAFRDRHDCETIHGWGMTETSPVGVANQLKAKHQDLLADEKLSRRNAQGRPLFGVDLRLVNENGGVLAHDGQTAGALQIKGHWIVDTYFGQSASTLTADGWFDTGDVASIDADGYLTIRDRTKDMIKSGGEWISSVELESIAMGHPAVAMAAAIGARHPKWDERPVIIAVLKPEHDLSEAELLAHFGGRVAKWQIPDAVIFVPALPLGGTGKMLKNKLRDTYGDVLNDRSVV